MWIWRREAIVLIPSLRSNDVGRESSILTRPDEVIDSTLHTCWVR